MQRFSLFFALLVAIALLALVTPVRAADHGQFTFYSDDACMNVAASYNIASPTLSDDGEFCFDDAAGSLVVSPDCTLNSTYTYFELYVTNVSCSTEAPSSQSILGVYFVDHSLENATACFPIAFLNETSLDVTTLYTSLSASSCPVTSQASEGEDTLEGAIIGGVVVGVIVVSIVSVLFYTRIRSRRRDLLSTSDETTPLTYQEHSS